MATEHSLHLGTMQVTFAVKGPEQIRVITRHCNGYANWARFGCLDLNRDHARATWKKLVAGGFVRGTTDHRASVVDAAIRVVKAARIVPQVL